MARGAKAFDQSHYIGNRLRAQFLHYPTALHFDGFFGSAELSADLLIEHSLRYPNTHLLLSLGQGLENCPVPVQSIPVRTCLA